MLVASKLMSRSELEALDLELMTATMLAILSMEAERAFHISAPFFASCLRLAANGTLALCPLPAILALHA